MTLTAKFRNKLDKKVFATGKLASDANFYAETSASYDEYGAKINVTETYTSVRIVPYNLFAGRVNYTPFGDMDEGDMDAVVPYDTTVTLKQKVTLLGETYEVKQFENYLVENGIVAVALRLAKKLN
jgi:hypothetical protein